MCDCLNVTLSDTASSDRRAENMRTLPVHVWPTNHSCFCFGILLHLQTCCLFMIIIFIHHHILDTSHPV